MHALARPARLAATALAVVVLPLALGACGELAEQATEKAVEKAVEAEGNGDVNVDFDTDGSGGVKVETSDGTFQSGEGLPEDFPIEQVPIVGDIQYGASTDAGGTRGWTIASRLSGSVDDALTEARSAFEAAGFTVDGEAAGAFVSVTSDAYNAVVSAGEDGNGGVTLSYVVSEVV